MDTITSLFWMLSIGDVGFAENWADERRKKEISARSQQNIKVWTSYLPPDCVRTMIKLRWDETT